MSAMCVFSQRNQGKEFNQLFTKGMDRHNTQVRPMNNIHCGMNRLTEKMIKQNERH